MAQRRWGATRCRKFLERNGISEIKSIGALTERQRHMLATQLQAAGMGSVTPMTSDRDLVLA
jgi:hypothetical protein